MSSGALSFLLSHHWRGTREKMCISYIQAVRMVGSSCMACPLFTLAYLLLHLFCDLALSHVQLCNTMDCGSPGPSVCGNFPGKKTGVGWHFLLQGIFPTQGSNPHLFQILHWQDDSLPLSHLGSPVIMYTCESWTIKKSGCRRIDAFELKSWRRFLRFPWTARRSNQSILKEISPESSLEGLMLKLQYFGHLMRRADSLEKMLMLRKIEGKRRREVPEDEMVI